MIDFRIAPHRVIAGKKGSRNIPRGDASNSHDLRRSKSIGEPRERLVCREKSSVSRIWPIQRLSVNPRRTMTPAQTAAHR